MSKLDHSANFAPSGWLDDLNVRLAELNRDQRFRENEAALLTLFYDSRLRVRKRIIPKVVMYARACENTMPEQWGVAICAVELALLNLLGLQYIQEVTHDSGVSDVFRQRVGGSASLFTITASGLEELQQLRPSLGLRFKAWIAVLPPWLLAASSIAGGIAACWKFVDLFGRIL
jgi:hypothetical protein